jgi:DNA-binding IclR family transcriptional regulator
MNIPPGPASVKSAERVLDIMERLAQDEGRAGRLAELGGQLGIPKSSLHGLLRVLVARGYVEVIPESRAYRLGPRTLGLANAYLVGLDLHQAARGVMTVVARLTGETITLDVGQGASAFNVARESGSELVRVITRVGVPFPSHASASGKLLLSALTDEQLDACYPDPELPAHTPNTITSLARLREELAAIRRTGVAYAHGELNEAIVAVALPIVGRGGRLLAALDAILPIQRADPDRLDRIERLMRAAARIVSARLGDTVDSDDPVADVEDHLERVWWGDRAIEVRAG